MTDHLPLARAKEILGDLIAFPTISGDSNLDLIGYLAGLLEEAGASLSVHHDETGSRANLFATLGPGIDGGIVLSGHTDVVPVRGQAWSQDPFAMAERDGRLFGRGACDMKGFIAAAVAMAPGFAALPLRRPLHFAFTYDEETGCFGARALLDVLAASGPRPAVAIVGEPTRMSLVEGHKGCCEYRTVFKGLDAHSSMPQQGVSAIEYAVRFAARLLELQEDVKKAVSTDSRFEPPYTTMQIGRIQGGIAQNVIAKDCWIDWEIRPIRRSDAEHVKGAIQDYVQTVLRPAMRKGFEAADIETETICEVEVLEVVEGSAAKQLVAGLTGRSEADVVAFASEAGLFQSAGISSIVCGPGSIRQAHKADEFVSLGQLEACLAMLDRLKAHLVRTAHDRGDAGSA